MSPTYTICKNHGYIAGEHYTCPECGEKTEVYSRITGYYRPVQNWNDGKAQEFKDRKVYKVAASGAVSVSGGAHKKETVRKHASEEAQICAGESIKRLLFTTKTCPNCATAKNALNDAHMDYEVVDAGEHRDLVKKYKVMQAPTLVVIGEHGVEKFANASNIVKFTEM